MFFENMRHSAISIINTASHQSTLYTTDKPKAPNIIDSTISAIATKLRKRESWSAPYLPSINRIKRSFISQS